MTTTSVPPTPRTTGPSSVVGQATHVLAGPHQPNRGAVPAPKRSHKDVESSRGCTASHALPHDDNHHSNSLLSPSTAASAAGVQTQLRDRKQLSHLELTQRSGVGRVSEDGSRNNGGKPAGDSRRRRRHSSSIPDENMLSSKANGRLFPGRVPSAIMSLSPSRNSPPHSPAPAPGGKSSSTRRGGKSGTRRRGDDENEDDRKSATTASPSLDSSQAPQAVTRYENLLCPDPPNRTRPPRQLTGGLVLLPRCARQPEAWLPAESNTAAERRAEVSSLSSKHEESPTSTEEVAGPAAGPVAENFFPSCIQSSRPADADCPCSSAPLKSRLGPVDVAPFVPRQLSTRQSSTPGIDRVAQQCPWKMDIELDPAISEYCISSRPSPGCTTAGGFDRASTPTGPTYNDSISTFQETMNGGSMLRLLTSYVSAGSISDPYNAPNARGFQRMSGGRDPNHYREYDGGFGAGQNYNSNNNDTADLWDEPSVASYSGPDAAGVEIFSLGDIRDADNHVRSGRSINQFYENKTAYRQQQDRLDVDRWKRADGDSRLNNIFFEDEEGDQKHSEESTFLRHVFKTGVIGQQSPRHHIPPPPPHGNQDVSMLQSLASSLTSLTPDQQKILRQRLTSLLEASHQNGRLPQYPQGVPSQQVSLYHSNLFLRQQNRQVPNSAAQNFSSLLRALRSTQQVPARNLAQTGAGPGGLSNPQPVQLGGTNAEFPPAKQAMLLNLLRQQISHMQQNGGNGGADIPPSQSPDQSVLHQLQQKQQRNITTASATQQNYPVPATTPPATARVGQFPYFLNADPLEQQRQQPPAQQQAISGVQEIHRLVQQMQAGRCSPQLQQLLQVKLQKQLQRQQQPTNAMPQGPRSVQQLMRALQRQQQAVPGQPQLISPGQHQQQVTLSALLQQLERHQQQALLQQQQQQQQQQQRQQQIASGNLPPNASAMVAHLTSLPLAQQHLVAQHLLAYRQQQQSLQNLQQTQQPDFRQPILKESRFNANAGVFVPGGSGLDFSSTNSTNSYPEKNQQQSATIVSGENNNNNNNNNISSSPSDNHEQHNDPLDSMMQADQSASSSPQLEPAPSDHIQTS